jgi:hypothetical protein
MKINRNAALQRKGMEIIMFLPRELKMHLKAIRQPLCTSKRI